MSLTVLVLILVIILVFGGGYGYQRGYVGGPGIGIIGSVLVVLFILWLAKAI